MKLILAATVTVLFPLSLVATAWADSAPTAQSSAASLETQAAEVTQPSGDEPTRLDNLANRINQRMGQALGRSEQSEEMPSIHEVLNLPENTVVRGTQRGGLAIGREF